MKWRTHLLYVLTLVGVTVGILSWGYWKVEDWKAAAAASAAGFEKAISAKDTAALKASLTDKEGKLAKALDDVTKLRARTVTVTKVITQPERIVVPEDRVQPFSDSCTDWQDEDGRFVFHQKDRNLSVNQKFSADVTTLVMSDGNVRVQTQLFEISPKTGNVLHSFDVAEKTIQLPLTTEKPPHLYFSFGALWLTDGTVSPSATVTYRLFGGLSASATIGRYSSAWVGWTWSPKHHQNASEPR